MLLTEIPKSYKDQKNKQTKKTHQHDTVLNLKDNKRGAVSHVKSKTKLL